MDIQSVRTEAWMFAMRALGMVMAEQDFLDAVERSSNNSSNSPREGIWGQLVFTKTLVFLLIVTPTTSTYLENRLKRWYRSGLQLSELVTQTETITT